MMARIKIIMLFCLITIGQIFGQTYSLEYSIYTINSQNNKFFLRTIPYDNIEQTSIGKTIVFNSDSTKVYEISRYFKISPNWKEIFLSNDGKTIAYVIDKEFEWNGIQNKSIEIFKNGVSIKQYQLSDLINCDLENEDCYLFYKEVEDKISRGIVYYTKYKENATDFEKELTKKATFLNDDTLYIFAKTNKLIEIDLNTANLNILPIENVNEDRFRQIKSFEIKLEKHNIPQGLPALSNGVSFENGLAKYLGMVVFPDSLDYKKYRQYTFDIQILLDRKGHAKLEKIEFHRGRLSEKKIKTFVESKRFKTDKIPNEAEKWRFTVWFWSLKFMNKDMNKAEKERQEEIIEEQETQKKRLVADSIDGIYIPRNLEECFIELNKILKPKDIETFKNLKDRDETVLYHLGLGMSLRNRWRLWTGSRLKQYFITKGIQHPDNMSGLILSFYYDWLNGKNDEWKKFEEK